MAGQRIKESDRWAIDAGTGRLLSEAEFRKEFQLQSNKHIGYATRLIVCSKEGEEVGSYVSGEVPSSPAGETRELFSDEPVAVAGRLELWRTEVVGSRTPIETVVAELSAMARRHWGDRDPKTLLPYLKSPGPPKQLVALVRSLAMAGAPMAVLHVDLDNFKNVNTEFGESVGDKVLREFTGRLRLAYSQLGVPVRTGGEEFSAILYGGTLAEIIEATDAVRAQMENEPLVAISRTNTCSIGLCLYPSAEQFQDIDNEDQVLEEARRAERRAKEDGKNRVVLMGPAPAAIPSPARTQDDLTLAALDARRIQAPDPRYEEEAFADFVVDRLVTKFADANVIGASLLAVKNQLGLLVGDYDVPLGRPALYQGIVDSLTWATWVARAVLRAAYGKSLLLDPNSVLTLISGSSGALSLKLGEEVISLDANVSLGGECAAIIGRPFYPAGEEPDGGIGRKAKATSSELVFDQMSPVLLLLIGDDARALAGELRRLVGAIVEIDDRPARGGGLPDFWQSNLSRVIRACLKNSNIGTIIAIGDVGCAIHTLKWLRRVGEQTQNSELQRRLSLTPDKIDALRARQLEIRQVEADRSSVIGEIAKVVEQLAPIDYSERVEVDQTTERLRRRLPIAPPDVSHRLGVTDGLQTRTLADAYPEAVQLIRGAEDSFDFVEATRGKFREFTGFKVVLTEPLAEMVPDYWATEMTSLDEYYRNNFVKSDGIFGKRLQRPLKDPGPILMDFAVDQTVQAIEARLPTRRINLPISPDDLQQPLGLSSIQILPRCRTDEQRLDVLCVWRTVDALVGFPFSAYGSICWARDFVSQVNERLESGKSDFHVGLGTLTYIALSFHMYLHDGDLEIARTIVQDASR